VSPGALRAKAAEAPDEFWAEAANGIAWYEPPVKTLDSSGAPFYRWFVGGRLNVCYNAVDRHVDAGRGAEKALIYDSPVAQTEKCFSFDELQREVALVAGGLTELGVAKGDTVVIYMPMVPEAVFAMLACARIGAIHSVVFGGFAANELAARIDDCKPKVVLSASCGIEVSRIVEYKPLLDGALELAEHAPARCVILQREQRRAALRPNRDLDWGEWISNATEQGCIAVGAGDPLYVLYTSGTTGRPKGVVRDSGGYAVALQWSMRNIYAAHPGETFWAASDIGWVVGHSYIVYGPLINGNATVLYEGKPVGTPDAGTFWRVASEHEVAVLFTAPTAIRAIKREDPQGALAGPYDLSRLRALFLAGERTDPATLEWARQLLQRPVLDHWWQTETGWPITANLFGLGDSEIRAGSAGRGVPGMRIDVFDGRGMPLAPGEMGTLTIRLPMPPGVFIGLWNAEDRCRAAYYADYPGHYKTGDAGWIDKDGFVFVMSRTDDDINVAGHRLSTGAMEEVLASHKDVAECAVFGVHDELKGQVPLGLLVLNADCSTSPEQVVEESIALVRERIGPVAAFKTAAIVSRLPKTRSGKILRGVMRRIANGEHWSMPATIDDAAILDEITSALATLNYPRGNS